MFEVIKNARTPTDFTIVVDLEQEEQIVYLFQNTDIKKPAPFVCDLDFINHDIYQGQQLSFK